jgi:alpha-glucosidase (family GH31 glycosyl hydrolase)
MDIFMKKNGHIYTGNVWPGDVYFVDYLHPNSTSYWHMMLDRLYSKLPFSGLWLDMN